MKFYAVVVALICAVIVGGALKSRDYATVFLAGSAMTAFAVIAVRKDK